MVSILQTRDRLGLIKTIARFDTPIDQKDVERKYGSGYYCLKETSPRFRVLWKGWVGTPSQRNEVEKCQSKDIRSLKKKTGYLAIGEAILAVGEVAGFGLTALNFVTHGQRLNRAEVMIETYGKQIPVSIPCPNCQQPLFDVFDTFCGSCGAKLASPDKRQLADATGLKCVYCNYPVKPNQRYCGDCGRQISGRSLSTVGFQFLPSKSWSLP